MPFTLPDEVSDDQSLTQAERTARAETKMVLAAIDLLNTVGIQGTTLVAIGEKSGYSRGLATHHFGSKAGLFDTLCKSIGRSWLEYLKRGVEGKIAAASYAREHQIPCLGLCLGMQVMTIEYARNVLGLPGANSSEFDPATPHPVIDLMESQRDVTSTPWPIAPGAHLSSSQEAFARSAKGS